MSLIEPAHNPGPLRPIPIHLPQTLGSHPPPSVMLEGLHFSPYRLGSLLPLGPPPLAIPTHEGGAASHDAPPSGAARDLPDKPSQSIQPRQPSSKDISPSQSNQNTTKPAKPLWNPALDLTTTHSSPKKGDTAESLPVVTSNLDPETAMTLTSHPVSCSSDASISKETERQEGTSPTENSQTLPETVRPRQSAGICKINEVPETSSRSNKTSNHQAKDKETKTDTPIHRPAASEIPSRKRKEPGSPSGQSPTHAKSHSQIPENNISNKRDRVVAPNDNTEKGSPTQSQVNPMCVTGDMRCVGDLTTDSQAYQHFHHQRRLALLASNLLQMGSHGHPNLVSHHPHAHLLPPLLQQHQHQHHHNRQLPPAATGVLPHHPGLSLHNALALAQSREVLERLSASSVFPNTSSGCDQLRQQHNNHNHNHHHHYSKEQIHLTQQQQQILPNLHEPKHSRKESQPAPSLSLNSSGLSTVPFLANHPKAEKLHPPHPLTLQNALVLAQSRALMERVNAGPILPHALKVDPLLPNTHHPHHPHSHPQHGMISPHGGNAPVGAGSLVGTAAGLGMGVAISATGGASGGSYGRKLFPCPQCRYTTDRRNNLKRHMLTMHQTSSKMLECCGILFSTKASLREHAMIFHYHGYTCYFCGRRFCRKALLKRHLSVHNGQKDFVCTVCDYATSHKSNLERHRKVHSRQEGDEDNPGEEDPNGDFRPRYHDDMKSNGSEAVSHDDVSEDELSVCSDFEDDIDVEIDVHSD